MIVMDTPGLTFNERDKSPTDVNRSVHKRWRQRLSAAVGTSLLSLAFIACTPSQTPELRLGTNIWPGYEPLYLAAELGYYPDNTVDLVEFLSASEVLRAFRNESIEAAALTLDETLILLDNEIPIKVVLVTDISLGGDAILAKPGIETVWDLTGKRIGVEGTALGAYMLSRALDIYNVSLDSLEVVQLEISEQEVAYRDDSVDAVVTFEPVRSKVLAAGAREIFSSREIPTEIVDVVVVHESYLRQHPDQVAAVVDGWFRAIEYLAERPDDAAASMSHRLGIAPAQVLESFERMALSTRQQNERLLGGSAPQLLESVRRLQDVMLSKELLTGPVTVDTLLTSTALRIANE